MSLPAPVSRPSESGRLRSPRSRKRGSRSIAATDASRPNRLIERLLKGDGVEERGNPMKVRAIVNRHGGTLKASGEDGETRLREAFEAAGVDADIRLVDPG